MNRRGLAVALSLFTLALSFGRWHLEAYAGKYWRGEPPVAGREECPDGMGEQIRAFALLLRQDEEASRRIGFFLRFSHQASTYLVGILGAPLVLLGLSPPLAFVALSALASLGLCALLWRLVGELLPGGQKWQLLSMLLFLSHPATVRCVVRPQTDALLAFFAFLAFFLGWRSRTARGWFWCGLCLAQSAALFVKIHALALLSVPAMVAFVHGIRGRRLGRVVLFGALVPAALWALVFWWFELFGSIERAWDYKNTFYADWDLWLVVRVIGWTSGPLLLLGLLARRFRDPTVRSLLLLVLGYVSILAVCGLPPLARFQYPAVAPFVVWVVVEMARRPALPRGAGAATLAVVSYQACLSFAIAFLFYYVRYHGPASDLGGLDRFLYYLI